MTARKEHFDFEEHMLAGDILRTTEADLVLLAMAAHDAYGIGMFNRILRLAKASAKIRSALQGKVGAEHPHDVEAVRGVRIENVYLGARQDVPVKTVQEYIAYAKSNPGKLTCACSGTGSSIHLSCELFKMKTGADILHVPYRGSGPAVADLLGGQVDSMFDNLPSSLPHVQAGKLRPIGVTSPQRLDSLPDTPTLAESGYKGFEAVTWFGILAPAGTPAPIVARLNKAINAALQQPDVADKLRSEGGDVLGGTAEQFGTLLKAEVPRWAKIVKDSGASLD